jgi:phospholipase C
MSMKRRDFLRSVAGVSGAVVAGSVLGEDLLADRKRGVSRLPPPDQSGIEHIVIVMMENRSFDHLLGWVPGTQGRQAGLQFFDNDGVAHRTHRLKTFAGSGSVVRRRAFGDQSG